MRFSGKKKKRGILSDKEVDKLFSEGNWSNNEGAKLGNLLASQTGMRAGEIMALQIKDIKEDRIHVTHSYAREEGGLKSTKTGEEREIPILPETRRLLLDHAKTYPFNEIGPESFIFYSSEKPGIPIGTETFLKRLKAALRSIGIKDDEQKARNLTFHGWRHYYARKMVDVLDQRTAKLTGHATQEMLDHYSNHANEQDFQKAAQATAEVFGRVIPFTQEAAQ
nr:MULTISPECIES: tyrosine-type recombinase/integrase [unclassified Oceanispirochaeta]